MANMSVTAIGRWPGLVPALAAAGSFAMVAVGAIAAAADRPRAGLVVFAGIASTTLFALLWLGTRLVARSAREQLAALDRGETLGNWQLDMARWHMVLRRRVRAARHGGLVLAVMLGACVSLVATGVAWSKDHPELYAWSLAGVPVAIVIYLCVELFDADLRNSRERRNSVAGTIRLRIVPGACIIGTRLLTWSAPNQHVTQVDFRPSRNAVVVVAHADVGNGPTAFEVELPFDDGNRDDAFRCGERLARHHRVPFHDLT